MFIRVFIIKFPNENKKELDGILENIPGETIIEYKRT